MHSVVAVFVMQPVWHCMIYCMALDDTVYRYPEQDAGMRAGPNLVMQQGGAWRLLHFFNMNVYGG